MRARKYNKRPVVKINGDHLDVVGILLNLVILIVDVAILISIWAAN